jgi:hypothetical protein
MKTRKYSAPNYAKRERQMLKAGKVKESLRFINPERKMAH